MKSRTYRLTDKIADDIDAEARKRKVPASEVARERLSRPVGGETLPSSLEAIADLIGSVDGLPSDLSRNKKTYLRAGYGRKHSR